MKLKNLLLNTIMFRLKNTWPWKELRKKSHDLKADLFDLKMKNMLGQVNNPLQIRQIRKDVARLKTALSAQLKKH